MENRSVGESYVSESVEERLEDEVGGMLLARDVFLVVKGGEKYIPLERKKRHWILSSL